VYLVDHAWSFHFQEAFNTLWNNQSLVERLEKLTEYSEKLDIPSAPEESKENAQSVFES
jgi:hypothetical protein